MFQSIERCSENQGAILLMDYLAGIDVGNPATLKISR
jgi:hypothetical protein